MAIDLTVEFSGAVMFARRKTRYGEQVVVLLLGHPPGPARKSARSHAGHSHEGDQSAHSAVQHYPLLLVNPVKVDGVQDLWTRLAVTNAHQRRLVSDIFGLDLQLRDEQLRSVMIDEKGDTGLRFGRVVDMSYLVGSSKLKKPKPAWIDEGLVKPSGPSNPKLVVARFFLDSGRLHAGTPVDRRFRDTVWRFVYKDSQGFEHERWKQRITDRVIFRCRLADPRLSFLRADGGRTPQIVFDDDAESATIRVTCLPGLGKRQMLETRHIETHFTMAYDTLVNPPPLEERALPKPSDRVYVDPGANCFPPGQARAK
jgi:hypothetical protein